MSPERKQIEQKASQETIGSIVTEIGLLAAKQGGVIRLPPDPNWNDFSDVLDRKEFNGYAFFVVCIKTPRGEYYEPEKPIALLHLYKDEDIGRRQVSYKITKEEDKLYINRYEEITPQLSDKERVEQLAKFAEMSQEERESNWDEAVQEMVEMNKLEREVGLSFVSEPEALELLALLQKINKT